MSFIVLDVAVLEFKLSNQALRQQLLQDYLCHAAADLEALAGAYRSQNITAIKQQLMILQGTASLVCAKPLERALSAFKQQQNEQTWSDIESLQLRLNEEINAYLA
ncbi:hypothetical protein K6Y31_14530 [Motilimonas cestriensis]|uniref:HPt domain-containing protein n=1 Tax=Motilimonas cestriensis TaxID=2742685 RepID=A0ABS8WAG1_9GAMM|nr:hypothetical protein [Motilimonas cestriensis]MCE2596026.1 hypothetical protein [Motilimonas cestriensis]